ncbi:hypothetical protein [Murimonas intestini]|uniref:hypothetical protein n=1 Tax=Murimonas intestini TaxID=1337051 RepID=UPI00248D233E|nr:hypothetical protein [Murimonas intestini]
MYYKEISTREVVQEEDAYLYAKENLDELEEKDKQAFVEWFFSGNWIRGEDKDDEADRKIN